jgi:daunorubicin resistance ABC transporter ATP-binding subunit
MNQPPQSNAFELTRVVKHYGAVKALDGVTLSAPKGKIYGLLGPNGAGKSTIVKVLSTLVRPDSGVARVGGIDVVADPGRVRQLIGMAGQYAAVDEFQTGYENILMVGELYGLPRKEARLRTGELLERLDLVDAGQRPVSTYSGGMRRRLDLGASLVGRPRILFLDEPTTGLDPKTRNDAWDIIRELVRDGTSILLTTQYLDEADELADIIAVVDHGVLIASGTSQELKSALGGDIIEFRLAAGSDRDRATTALAPLARERPSFDEITGTMSVPVDEGSRDLMAVVQTLNDQSIPVKDLSLHRPSLDDVFLSLTGAGAA